MNGVKQKHFTGISLAYSNFIAFAFLHRYHTRRAYALLSSAIHADVNLATTI